MCILLVSATMTNAQVYSDHFDNDDPAYMGGSASYTFAESGTELTVTATNTGAFDNFTYQTHDPVSGTPVSVDASGNNKVYVRVKASSVGTALRLDLQDAAGYLTSLPGLTKTLTNQYMVLEYDFSGQYKDGGYGGTPCMAGPCDVDSSSISALLFYAEPGAGGFTGDIVIDYVSFGTPPDTTITSDVYQNHFTDQTALNSFLFVAPGYTVSQAGTELSIVGDGTGGAYDPLTYGFINHVTNDTFDIDITGNNKLFVKAKSTVDGTALRVDAQDISGFASTQGSITKLLGTDYAIYEYDFSGVLEDLGYGGTPCTQATAPCPVDGSRIADILMFIEPGTGAFPGTITIDYISFGVSLEPLGPEPDLIYEDHFGNENLEFTGGSAGLTVTESGSELSIVGDGTAPPFASVSYLLHDKDSAAEIFLDMAPGGNKVFLKMKVDSGSVPIRVDLIDTAGYHTSQASLTRVINDEYAVYEYDFSGSYIDGGFGGTSCPTGPCPVDNGSIKQVLIFVDAIQGGFDGEVLIEYLSIGQEAGEDAGPKGIVNYFDEIDDNTSLYLGDPGGFTSMTANGEWTITGDGTAGPYAAINYDTHNDIGESILADAVGSNDKLYVMAKSSTAGTVLRIDLKDNQDYLTNLSPPSATLTTDYQIYEFDYAGAYTDGAYGGSPCTVQGCPVDGERIAALQFFVDPVNGGFSGEVTIDWLSFGVNSVGIDQEEFLSELRVFPNPAETMVNLEYTLVESAEVEIVVTNIVGQEVARINAGRKAAGSQQELIQIELLPPGMYVIQMMTDQKQSGNLKFIKR